MAVGRILRLYAQRGMKYLMAVGRILRLYAQRGMKCFDGCWPNIKIICPKRYEMI